VLPVSDAKATTALSYLFFDDAANLDERRDVAERYASRHLGGTAVVGTTGAAPARLAQYEEIQSALPLVEAASIALILLIVGLAFRSLGAPLVALAAAGIAYAVTIRVLPWAGERTGASVPAEVEPIIVVLLLGLVTDYSVFFLSETRRRLRRGQTRLEAARDATRCTAPIVFTAGLIVAAGTGALVVGKPRVLPRLRTGAGAHDADRARRLDHARAGADRAVRRPAVRRRPQARRDRGTGPAGRDRRARDRARPPGGGERSRPGQAGCGWSSRARCWRCGASGGSRRRPRPAPGAC